MSLFAVFSLDPSIELDPLRKRFLTSHTSPSLMVQKDELFVFLLVKSKVSPESMGQVRQNFPFSPRMTSGFANSSASSQLPLRVLQLYHLVPQSVRFFFYRLILPIGTYLYGTGTYGVLNVQRLPFNLYLKRASSQRLVNEARALELVAKHTTLNAPRVLDFIELPASEECWMLTTRIVGDVAGKCLPLMDAEQLERFSIDFRDYVDQIRSIPNPYPRLICSPLGGECRDCRIDHDNGGDGPYDKIEDLNKHLMTISSPIPEDADRALVAEVHSQSYRVFFTHADLKPGNVLVHSGSLSGFVDWEFAGWYPEYWEYSKACYVVYRWQLWLDTMKKVFPEYRGEWRAERILQAHTSPL